MAQFWDYHVSGRSYVGLTPERLAVVRAQDPGGRAVTSVAHIARVPGDDETDHIMRHKYGVDPATYRGVYLPRRATADALEPRAPRARPARPARAAARRSSRPAPRPAPRRHARTSLHRLVREALAEAPGELGPKLDRLIEKHLASGKLVTRTRFVGLPLVLRTTARGVHAAFDL